MGNESGGIVDWDFPFCYELDPDLETLGEANGCDLQMDCKPVFFRERWVCSSGHAHEHDVAESPLGLCVGCPLIPYEVAYLLIPGEGASLVRGMVECLVLGEVEYL